MNEPLHDLKVKIELLNLAQFQYLKIFWTFIAVQFIICYDNLGLFFLIKIMNTFQNSQNTSKLKCNPTESTSQHIIIVMIRAIHITRLPSSFSYYGIDTHIKYDCHVVWKFYNRFEEALNCLLCDKKNFFLIPIDFFFYSISYLYSCV